MYKYEVYISQLWSENKQGAETPWNKIGSSIYPDSRYYNNFKKIGEKFAGKNKRCVIPCKADSANRAQKLAERVEMLIQTWLDFNSLEPKLGREIFRYTQDNELKLSQLINDVAKAQLVITQDNVSTFAKDFLYSNNTKSKRLNKLTQGNKKLKTYPRVILPKGLSVPDAVWNKPGTHNNYKHQLEKVDKNINANGKLKSNMEVSASFATTLITGCSSAPNLKLLRDNKIIIIGE